MLFQHKIVGEKYEKEYINKISVIKDVAVCSDCEPKDSTREFVTEEVLPKSGSFILKSYRFIWWFFGLFSCRTGILTRNRYGWYRLLVICFLSAGNSMNFMKSPCCYDYSIVGECDDNMNVFWKNKEKFIGPSKKHQFYNLSCRWICAARSNSLKRNPAPHRLSRVTKPGFVDTLNLIPFFESGKDDSWGAFRSHSVGNFAKGRAGGNVSAFGVFV